MAVCLAVIDKDVRGLSLNYMTNDNVKNSPIFLQCSSTSGPTGSAGTGRPKAEKNSFMGERNLKLHYTVHSSLDIIEEKLAHSTSSASGRTADLREPYLGLLLSTEEYKVYGYATNTKIKFVLVVELGNTVLKDQEIRSIFKKLHNVYCDTVSSPFYVPGTQLQSMSLNTVASEILNR